MLETLLHTHVGKPTLKLVVQSLFYMVLSWGLSVVTVIVVAVALQTLGRSMSWFAHPMLILPLYAVPSFMSIAAVHVYWISKVSTSKI